MQNEKKLDNSECEKYNTSKMELIETINQKAIELAGLYKNNIKIELNVNNSLGHCKVSIQEFIQ